MHLWPKRSQKEHVGLSPGQRDFFLLIDRQSRIRLKHWGVILTGKARMPGVRV